MRERFPSCFGLEGRDGCPESVEAAFREGEDLNVALPVGARLVGGMLFEETVEIAATKAESANGGAAGMALPGEPGPFLRVDIEGCLLLGQDLGRAVDLDGGCDELKNPITGQDLDIISGIPDFESLRTTLQTHTNFAGYDTVIVDNVTVAQDMAEPYLFRTVKTDKGATVKNLEGYGWHKGYKHLYDAMRNLLTDCDGLIQRIESWLCVREKR